MKAKAKNRAQMPPDRQLVKLSPPACQRRASVSVNGPVTASKSKGEPSKKDSAESAAKEAKQRLIEALRNAWSKAPWLAELLNHHCEKIVIRIPGAGTFKVFNYKEGIEKVLASAKRLKIGSIEKSFRDLTPSRAERRQILKEARRLAKRGKR